MRLRDARMDRAGFDDAHWKAASSAQMMPPIRVVDTITLMKTTTPRPGVYIFDLGQNISGVVEMRVRGPQGTRVQLRHAELLYDDGTLNVEHCAPPKLRTCIFCAAKAAWKSTSRSSLATVSAMWN